MAAVTLSAALFLSEASILPTIIRKEDFAVPSTPPPQDLETGLTVFTTILDIFIPYNAILRAAVNMHIKDSIDQGKLVPAANGELRKWYLNQLNERELKELQDKEKAKEEAAEEEILQNFFASVQ